jgi:hypothetical protein
VTIGERLTDGELYSRPWIFGFVMESFEGLEDRLREFFLGADALIDNCETYIFLVHGYGGDVYLRRLAWLAIFDSVRNNILHQAGELRPVRQDVCDGYFDVYLGISINDRIRQIVERGLDLLSQVEDF